MSDSEWDKLMYRLKPYLNENHIQFGLYQDIRAVGDRREQKLKAIKKREPFCCGYPIIDELDRNNYVAVFRCGNCFRIWVEFLGVEE